MVPADIPPICTLLPVIVLDNIASLPEKYACEAPSSPINKLPVTFKLPAGNHLNLS